MLRSVCVMEHQLTSASIGADGDSPMLLTARHDDLAVRPGESNPGRMLSAVLLLVLAIVLGLVWWLV